MKKLILITSLALILSSCLSHELKEPYKSDFSTSGTLTDDCFQVIITTAPDKNLKIMSEQRANSLKKARNNIKDETERQITSFYTTSKSLTSDGLPDDKMIIIKTKSDKYTESGKVEYEYFLIDNSAVLIFRIFKKGIKNEILNI